MEYLEGEAVRSTCEQKTQAFDILLLTETQLLS